jgi:hypothetical protein
MTPLPNCFLQNEPIISMKTKGSQEPHPNPEVLPSGEIFE